MEEAFLHCHRQWFPRLILMNNDDEVAIIAHPNHYRYPNQKISIIVNDGYAYLVPFVESETEISLKTIIPSCKATKKYIGAKTMIKLDQEEQEILESYEKDRWQPVVDMEAEIEKHRQYAEATFKRDKRISIRISSRDLNALRKRALIEGMPYQTLIASVLHKYVDGRLKETA